MELKLRFSFSTVPDTGLLIVPYGIETSKKTQTTSSVLPLLIVPYGIETRKKVPSYSNSFQRF